MTELNKEARNTQTCINSYKLIHGKSTKVIQWGMINFLTDGAETMEYPFAKIKWTSYLGPYLYIN